MSEKKEDMSSLSFLEPSLFTYRMLGILVRIVISFLRVGKGADPTARQWQIRLVSVIGCHDDAAQRQSGSFFVAIADIKGKVSPVKYCISGMNRVYYSRSDKVYKEATRWLSYCSRLSKGREEERVVVGCCGSLYFFYLLLLSLSLVVLLELPVVCRLSLMMGDGVDVVSKQLSV